MRVPFDLLRNLGNFTRLRLSRSLAGLYSLRSPNPQQISRPRKGGFGPCGSRSLAQEFMSLKVLRMFCLLVLVQSYPGAAMRSFARLVAFPSDVGPHGPLPRQPPSRSSKETCRDVPASGPRPMRLETFAAISIPSVAKASLVIRDRLFTGYLVDCNHRLT